MAGVKGAGRDMEFFFVILKAGNVEGSYVSWHWWHDSTGVMIALVAREEYGGG